MVVKHWDVQYNQLQVLAVVITLKSTSGLGGRTHSFFSCGSSVKTYVTIKGFILSRGRNRKEMLESKEGC